MIEALVPVNVDAVTEPDGVTLAPLNEPEPDQPCECAWFEPPKGTYKFV